MISNILKEVESPYSDKFINFLVEQYIQCGCDDDFIYSKINNLNKSSNIDNSLLNNLIDLIYKHGVNYSELWNYKGEKNPLIYDINNSWVILKSDEEPMKDEELVYRIYLNLNRKNKVDFVTEYLKKCRDNNLKYEFKFSKNESRTDQIVILSGMEDFEANIGIVENLTSDMQLGETPSLIGKYKNNIGIGEEYYNNLYSPTCAKLRLLKVSVMKYLCDHKDEISKDLSEEEMKNIKEINENFEYRYKREIERKERLGEKYKDISKRKYQKKSTIDCLENHIESIEHANFWGVNIEDLSESINKIYMENPEEFITEITENYKNIGREVWGFSNNFVFSVDTENKFLQEKTNEYKETDDIEV